MTLVIGIDPGITGAIAAVGESSARTFDMPVVHVEVGGKERSRVDVVGLAKVLTLVRGDGSGPVVAFIEAAQASPQMGVSSAFGYGLGFGMVQGVLAAFGIPFEAVHPLRWKREMGLLKKHQTLDDRDRDKSNALALARKLYPQLAVTLQRQKDNGRADALLIAHYGWEQVEGALFAAPRAVAPQAQPDVEL